VVSQRKQVVYTSPAGNSENSTALNEKRERWIFDNCEVILTPIHWLGTPLYLPRCFIATLVICNEPSLAKGQYHKDTRGSDIIMSP